MHSTAYYWGIELSGIVLLLALVVNAIRMRRNAPPREDVNAPCPACGNRKGKLDCIQDQNSAVYLKHTCLVCGAEWHTSTVVKPDRADLIRPRAR